MKKLLLLVALLACGCAKNGFAAFVVNQDAQSAGSKPGKSYSAEPCSLMVEKGALFILNSGQEDQPSHLRLQVNFANGTTLESVLGKTLEGGQGEVQVETKKLELDKITVTVQTLQNGVARGNFNARVKGQNPPWEVVGSFEALVRI